jgi:hypothetical protein
MMKIQCFLVMIRNKKYEINDEHSSLFINLLKLISHVDLNIYLQCVEMMKVQPYLRNVEFEII